MGPQAPLFITGPPRFRPLARQLGHHLIQGQLVMRQRSLDPTCARLRASPQQLQIDLLVAKTQRPAAALKVMGPS